VTRDPWIVIPEAGGGRPESASGHHGFGIDDEGSREGAGRVGARLHWSQPAQALAVGQNPAGLRAQRGLRIQGST